MLIVIVLSNCFLIIKKINLLCICFYCCEKIEYTGALNAKKAKEELKAGRTLFTAINAGFDRAFTSIFDSNMTTIITCVILYFLGTSIVKGFALTLIIGVVISMFTAITVTKNFMHLLFGAGQLKHPGWFGIKQSEIGKAYEAKETKKEKAKFGILD